jgi:hypothetical protein
MALSATAVSGLLLLQGCAHGALEKKIDEKISLETPINSRADLNIEAGSLIQNAPGLTDDQRSRLSVLRVQTSSALAQLTEQSLRLRDLLIHDVVSQSYDPDEVQAIKSRLKGIEEKRLSLMFDSVDQANVILGREAVQHPQILNSMMMEIGHQTRE